MDDPSGSTFVILDNLGWYCGVASICIRQWNIQIVSWKIIIKIEELLILFVKIKSKEHVQYLMSVRRVWRYQRGNQNPYIEEEQTTQWPKEKVQKDKQRSTKHKVTRTPLKTGGEVRCSGRVGRSCSTSDPSC